MFRTPQAPSRLNPLILSGTISHTADEVCFSSHATAPSSTESICSSSSSSLPQVSEFCSQSLAKLFLTEPLQGAKQSLSSAGTALGQ